MADPVPRPASRRGRDGRPLAGHVYTAVRDMIVEGELAPGTVMVQEQLAEQLGVSRTPLREALTRLVHEGLVARLAGGGFTVRELTDATVAEVHEVRRHLEMVALEGACGRHDPVQLATLEMLVAEMVAADPTDVAAQFDLNRRFHRATVAPCGNGFLLEMIDQLWDHPVNRRITRSYVRSSPGNVATMIAQHRGIVDALRLGDHDALRRRVDEHMLAGYADAAPSGPPEPSHS